MGQETEFFDRGDWQHTKLAALGKLWYPILDSDLLA